MDKWLKRVQAIPRTTIETSKESPAVGTSFSGQDTIIANPNSDERPDASQTINMDSDGDGETQTLPSRQQDDGREAHSKIRRYNEDYIL